MSQLLIEWQVGKEIRAIEKVYLALYDLTPLERCKVLCETCLTLGNYDLADAYYKMWKLEFKKLAEESLEKEK